MTALESRLMQRLQGLPPERVAEVFDFVDFLASRELRGAAAKRLATAFEQIDGLGLPPIPDSEIDAEVQAVRLARKSAFQPSNPSHT